MPNDSIPVADSLPSVKRIPLSQGKFAIVDAADFERVAQFTWSLNNHGYAVRGVGGRKNRRTEYLHLVIFGQKNAPRVDHANRNRLDCRRDNLRSATHQQNCFNRGIYKTNRSGRKGVAWDASRKKWGAFICINGVRKFLGRFKSIEDASDAYQNAARSLHGEFAGL